MDISTPHRMVSSDTIITLSLKLLILSLQGGGSWTETSAPQAFWYSIASSSSGQYLAAVQNNNGYIFTSLSG